MIKAIPLALLCALPLTAAQGQSVAQPDTMKGDIAAFHGDQNTLVQAIQTMQQATGGRVLDIRFSDAHGHPGYHAVIALGGQVQFFHIEERSHKVVQIDAASAPVWMLGWRGRADVHVAEHASVPLINAVRTAESAQNGAPALAAGIARSASNPTSEVHAYTVLLDVNGRVQSVSIDDSTGEVIANAAALSSVY